MNRESRSVVLYQYEFIHQTRVKLGFGELM